MLTVSAVSVLLVYDISIGKSCQTVLSLQAHKQCILGRWAAYPPAAERLDEMYQLGYTDAEEWLNRRQTAQATVDLYPGTSSVGEFNFQTLAKPADCVLHCHIQHS